MVGKSIRDQLYNVHPQASVELLLRPPNLNYSLLCSTMKEKRALFPLQWGPHVMLYKLGFGFTSTPNCSVTILCFKSVFDFTGKASDHIIKVTYKTHWVCVRSPNLIQGNNVMHWWQICMKHTLCLHKCQNGFSWMGPWRPSCSKPQPWAGLPPKSPPRRQLHTHCWLINEYNS